jgi:hypothetical protein
VFELRLILCLFYVLKVYIIDKIIGFTKTHLHIMLYWKYRCQLLNTPFHIRCDCKLEYWLLVNHWIRYRSSVKIYWNFIKSTLWKIFKHEKCKKLGFLGFDLLLLLSRDFHIILYQYQTAFVCITASKKAQKYVELI